MVRCRLSLVLVVVLSGIVWSAASPQALAQRFYPFLLVEQSQTDTDFAQVNTFFDSFNTFWQSSQREAFQPLQGEDFTHYRFGGGFRMVAAESNFGFSIQTAFTYGRVSTDRQFRYTNGMGHDMDVTHREYSWDFQMGPVIAKRILLQGILNGYFRDLSYRMYTRFQDGSRSLGNVYKISGVYTGLGSSLEVGVGGGIRLGPLYLNAKWVTPLSGFPPGQNLVDLDDYDNDEFPPTQLPADYALWATDPVEFAQQDAAGAPVGVKVDALRGSRITFGLELWLGRW